MNQSNGEWITVDVGYTADQTPALQENLHVWLTQTTKGEPSTILRNHGPEEAFEAYRQIVQAARPKSASQGLSKRKLAYQPAVAKSIGDVRGKISE